MGGPENPRFPLSPQDRFENKTWRVIAEFPGGEAAYGHEGLCVRAVQTEEGQARLTLLGTDAKCKTTSEVVLADHCAEVHVLVKKLRPLFEFKRQSLEKKLRILGRCGITDVMRSAPLSLSLGRTSSLRGSTFRCG